MTQKDKELLLKDFCARLPYRVFVKEKNRNTPIKCDLECHPNLDDLEKIKLYLRPLSSMTEEEKKELSDITGGKFTYVYGILSNSYQNKDDGEWHNKCFRYVTLESIILVIDWLNKYNFDYRGLIEKGLAIEAPEGMYK